MSKMMVDVKVGEALFVGDTSIKLNKNLGRWLDWKLQQALILKSGFLKPLRA